MLNWLKRMWAREYLFWNDICPDHQVAMEEKGGYVSGGMEIGTYFESDMRCPICDATEAALRACKEQDKLTRRRATIAKAKAFLKG